MKDHKADIRQCILNIGSIYPTFGQELYDEPRERCIVGELRKLEGIVSGVDVCWYGFGSSNYEYITFSFCCDGKVLCVNIYMMPDGVIVCYSGVSRGYSFDIAEPGFDEKFVKWMMGGLAKFIEFVK